MEKTLKILILEDTPADAELTLWALKKSGLNYTYTIVDNEADYVSAINNLVPDVVLSDHSLPTFNSLEALRILKHELPSAAFILITGTVSEEFAAEILREGADDYLLKTSLTRLPGAIINAFTKKLAERERENNYVKLQEANNELKTFIYRASHDIRGPICSLKGLINIAKEEATMIEIQKMIGFMDKSADRLDLILRNLLETIDLRDCPMVLEKIDFDPIIKEILDQYKSIASFQTIKLSVKLNTNKEFISDKVIVQKILKNIIDNAVKYHNYSMEFPFINIEVKSAEKGFQLVIADNGIGINSELSDKVFGMFFRGTNHVEGTGLGLYLTKIAVERLGGTVQLNSEENVGTTVSIFIPDQLKERVQANDALPEKI